MLYLKNLYFPLICEFFNYFGGHNKNLALDQDSEKTGFSSRMNPDLVQIDPDSNTVPRGISSSASDP
jgi:hypothetical protein